MKTARLFLIILGLGAFNFGLSYAGEPPRPTAEQILRENHLASDRSPELAHGIQAHEKADPKVGKSAKPEEDSQDAKPKAESLASLKSRPAGLVKSNVRFPSEKESHFPESKKPAPVAREGLLPGKTGKPREPLARSPVADEAGVPYRGVLCSRNATAAMVGRVLITSNTKYSTAAFGGPASKRNP